VIKASDFTDNVVGIIDTTGAEAIQAKLAAGPGPKDAHG
jgi:hypothetical protein